MALSSVPPRFPRQFRDLNKEENSPPISKRESFRTSFEMGWRGARQVLGGLMAHGAHSVNQTSKQSVAGSCEYAIAAVFSIESENLIA